MSLESPVMSAVATSPQPVAAPTRPAALKISISGKYYDKGNAKVSVYHHGLLYGDGVCAGLRRYGGKVFRLKVHLKRLWASAKAIWRKMPLSEEEMTKAVNETLATN